MKRRNGRRSAGDCSIRSARRPRAAGAGGAWGESGRDGGDQQPRSAMTIPPRRVRIGARRGRNNPNRTALEARCRGQARLLDRRRRPGRVDRSNLSRPLSPLRPGGRRRGQPRGRIPRTRNLAGFPEGYPGDELSRGCRLAGGLGRLFVTGRVTRPERTDGAFTAEQGAGPLAARSALLATGVQNRRPPMDESLHAEALALRPDPLLPDLRRL